MLIESLAAELQKIVVCMCDIDSASLLLTYLYRLASLVFICDSNFVLWFVSRISPCAIGDGMSKLSSFFVLSFGWDFCIDTVLRDDVVSFA